MAGLIPDRIEEIGARAEALQARVIEETGRTLVIEDLIKSHPKRLVFGATLDGAPVVAKLFLTPDAADIVTAQGQELTRAAAALARATPLACAIAAQRLGLPQEGLAILDRAPGARLDQVLAEAGRVRRSVVLSHAGRWLAAYGGEAVETRPFAPNHWLQKEAPRFAQLDRLGGGQRGARVRARLDHWAARASGTPTARGPVHGDWSPLNAFLSEDRLTGIDVQGQSRLPLALDAARFLTSLATFVDGPPPTAGLGVAQGDLTAFEAPLSAAERAHVLPFFLGLELMRRTLGNHGTPAGPKAAAALDAWLTDPHG